MRRLILSDVLSDLVGELTEHVAALRRDIGIARSSGLYDEGIITAAMGAASKLESAIGELRACHEAIDRDTPLPKNEH